MIPPDSQNSNDENASKSTLKKVTVKGNIILWCVTGIVFSTLGILLTTGLSTTVWLFLLYPIFISVLLLSLGGLALQLIRYF